MLDLVKYDSMFNDAYPNTALRAYESVLLFMVFAKYREQILHISNHGNTDDPCKVVITNEEIASVLNLPNSKRYPAYIFDLVNGTYMKLIKYNIVKRITGSAELGNRVVEACAIVTHYVASEEKREYAFSINPEFIWILDNPGLYTSFNLKEYSKIRNPYSQILFRCLKQWKKAGRYKVTDLEHLRSVLSVPPSYPNAKLTSRIIRPAVQHLTEVCQDFKDLKVQPIYFDGSSHVLTGYVFEWTVMLSDPEEQCSELLDIPEIPQESYELPLENISNPDNPDEPSVEEVQSYFQNRQYKSSAELFRTYYRNRNWEDRSGFPIEDWKGKADEWELREQLYDKRTVAETPSRSPNGTFTNFRQRQYNEEEYARLIKTMQGGVG